MTVDVKVTEVCLVDGLQLISEVLPTEGKIWCISALAKAGLQEIDAASFVPPALMPQFADAVEVCRYATGLDGLSARLYAPNLKGFQRALDAGARYISYGVSASEAHSLSNYRKSREAQFAGFEEIVALCGKLPAAERPVVQVSFSCVFGCSIQGAVPARELIDDAVRFMQAGADELQLCDTVGYAHPAQVTALLADLKREVSGAVRSLHFHDTRGLGLANTLASLESDIRSFDSSLGGLGGCPFAPGATGNVNSEDLVFMLESMGMKTGIDLEQLIAVRSELARRLPTGVFVGNVARAGLPKDFHRSVGYWRDVAGRGQEPGSP